MGCANSKKGSRKSIRRITIVDIVERGSKNCDNWKLILSYLDFKDLILTSMVNRKLYIKAGDKTILRQFSSKKLSTDLSAVSSNMLKQWVEKEKTQIKEKEKLSIQYEKVTDSTFENTTAITVQSPPFKNLIVSVEDNSSKNKIMFPLESTKHVNPPKLPLETPHFMSPYHTFFHSENNGSLRSEQSDMVNKVKEMSFAKKDDSSVIKFMNNVQETEVTKKINNL